MKNTAVEFLIDNLHYFYSLKWDDIVEQAKEMERQQIIDFAYWLTDSKNIKTKDASIEELLEIYKKA